MKKYKQIVVGIIGIIIFWQSTTVIGIFNPIYFASPYEVFLELIKMFSTLNIYLDILNTVNRLIISIVVSALIGIPIGIIFGYFSNIYKYIEGVVDFLRSVPPIVIYPLFLISLGSGDISRIGVSVFGSVIVLILIISRGLFQQSKLRRKYFSSLGANKKQIIKHIVWYEALPHIILAMRTVISLSIIVIIVTEMMIGSKFGLGTRVQNVQITSNIPDLFVTIIIIGLIGVIFNKVLVWFDKKYVFWKLN